MSARPAIVLALLSASIASASAQTIVGDWVTSTDDTVHVSSSNTRYVGTFTSGPYASKMAMAVVPTATGQYSGNLFRYRGSTRPTQVKARIRSGQLSFDACFTDADAYACTTIETWRREFRRPSPLPPVIRDGIRKPAPPLVILRPDIRMQGTR